MKTWSKKGESSEREENHWKKAANSEDLHRCAGAVQISPQLREENLVAVLHLCLPPEL